MIERNKRTVLITGGASGIGKATALKLLDAGYDLIVHYRSSAQGVREVATYGKRLGRNVSSVQSDLSRSQGIARLSASLKRTNSRLHAIVHCAGANEKMSYTRISLATCERIFAVNMVAPIFLTQSLLPCLKASRVEHPAIVFVGSSYSFIGGGEKNILYTASKSGLLGLTKSLAKLLAPNIRVNCVVPGFIESNMLFEGTPSHLNKKWERIPFGRFGTPEEVAETICFLISEKARYITGQAIHVNGGVYFG